jgi:hypothetical protein
MRRMIILAFSLPYLRINSACEFILFCNFRVLKRISMHSPLRQLVIYLTILVKKKASGRDWRDAEISCNAAVGEQRFAGKPVQDSCCMSVLHAFFNVAHKVQRYIHFSVASELVSDVNCFGDACGYCYTLLELS